MKLDFNSMNKSQLRAYVISHPNEKAAFHIFVDRFTSEAPTETFDIPKSIAEVEEVDIVIRKKLEQFKEK
ncbi:DUF6887 family protein [Hydrocoleum sp. CS-953]|uniref:DUF6887 family protein n=1 Tax=Microcoleaceae TaxID=1892252 RepID=UPI001AEFCA57|nr:hypothetical protein [Hydrocoleum sp. CS-953]